MLIPKWTAKNITIPIKEFEKVQKSKMIIALHYIGQEFINLARDGGGYTDRTGNLRSSIGYAIFDNGKEIESQFEPKGKDEDGKGVAAAKKLANEKATKKGLSLIVTAGMEYAEAVESKQYTVLTAFAPSKNKIQRDLEKILKYVR